MLPPPFCMKGAVLLILPDYLLLSMLLLYHMYPYIYSQAVLICTHLFVDFVYVYMFFDALY
jgi:hypothetical protein